MLDGAHAHGYLLTAARPGVPARPWPADVTGWSAHDDILPGLTLRSHPRTVVRHAAGVNGVVVLLGHPVDVDAGISDAARVATRLCATWDLQDDDALVREAAGLGGRWTLLAARRHGELLVVPDAHATQPVFYATAGGHLALASTPALAAAALDLPVDEDALTLLAELRERRRGAVTYLPGLRTPYEGLLPLVPNCLLRIDPATLHVEHRRFWPWQDREERTDTEAVYQRFRERLAAHVRLLAGLGVPALSLTAGGDSRVTAALAHEQVRAGGGLAFTYVNPRDARNGAAAMADVTGASAVAAQLGIPHRVLRWRQPPEGGAFDLLHRRTYAPLVPSRGAAHAMWADLPRDLVQLQSNGAETGTAFLRRRTDEPLSPLRLARMMMHAAEGLEDLAGRMYTGYLEHAEMQPARLHGYDHHDVFYWEQRMGRWGWQKFLDGDLGHRVLAPFNDRVLLETMLALPYPQRESKMLLARVLEDVPAARLPRTPAAPASLARSVTGLLPGRATRRLDAVVGRRERAAETSRLAFAQGYAVLPPGAHGTRVPAGWGRLTLPQGAFGRTSGAGMVLRHHPRLPHAFAGDGSGWVLVLGEPAWLRHELDGPQVVARVLHDLLVGGTQGPQLLADDRGRGLDAVVAAGAGLVGRYVVVVGDRRRTLVMTDPLSALGAHLPADSPGLVSHARLLVGDTLPLSPDEVLAVEGAGPTLTELDQLVDLPSLALPRHVEDPTTGADRLARHTRILSHRGPAWLGLTASRAGAELLPHLVASAGGAITWWDRTADDAAAADVIAASERAREAGVQHRVVGLREDADGGRAGDARRAAAAAALRTTWGEGTEDRLPVSSALDAALPADAVLWLGDLPGTGSRTWELVQGVRRVALPFSDRLLPHLPRR
ncbi:hypothetical protein GCM10011366_20800 [Ornithinimicrobium tianjinense]|uniref:Uncharacterized protein n=1 Tax=Ornithinimicrobium tianjinense TaxID=1195761 RepID=A0A917BPZ7_9MICO|nr:hypothetical protein GCM10011366_20800 [Ornithinimicrobium tianjinense]